VAPAPRAELTEWIVAARAAVSAARATVEDPTLPAIAARQAAPAAREPDETG
jgi:hypothetical protein